MEKEDFESLAVAEKKETEKKQRALAEINRVKSFESIGLPKLSDCFGGLFCGSILTPISRILFPRR